MFNLMLFIINLCVLAQICVTHEFIDGTMAATFAHNGIKPDIINGGPSLTLSVKYDSANVKLGNEISTSLIQKQPVPWYFQTEKDSLYTFLVVDPDVPSRSNPTERSYLHWLIVNVGDGDDFSTGDELVEYAAPAPAEGSGLHRIVFVVYEQKGQIAVDGEIKREKFDVKEFSKKYELDNPVYGNFFQTKFETDA